MEVFFLFKTSSCFQYCLRKCWAICGCEQKAEVNFKLKYELVLCFKILRLTDFCSYAFWYAVWPQVLTVWFKLLREMQVCRCPLSVLPISWWLIIADVIFQLGKTKEVLLKSIFLLVCQTLGLRDGNDLSCVCLTVTDLIIIQFECKRLSCSVF